MRALGVLGLGLIGGSVALSARRAFGGVRIVGADFPEVAHRAVAAGVVDVGCGLADPSLADQLAACELVVVALPVGATAEQLPSLLALGPTVTDVGSTKGALVAAAAAHGFGQRFVAGHPMAGLPRSGLGAATAELFREAPWFLCRGLASDERCAQVEDFVSALGAVPRWVEPAEHDRAVALTSHVPQLIASALVKLAVARGDDWAAGPSFARTTRVAGGNPVMWRDIFGTNGAEIAAAARLLSAELSVVADALECGDPSAAEALLSAARDALVGR